MDKTDIAVKTFTKQQLIDLAQSLGISKVQENFESHVLVDIIRQQEVTLDSELYRKFQEVFEDKVLELDEFEVPNCFEFPNDLDVSCERCFLYRNCSQELFDKLPECFGILYDETECSQCIIKESCEVKLDKFDSDAQYEVYLFQDVTMLTNILNSLALFRHYYQAWPSLIVMSKQNRYWDMRIKDIKRKVDYQVWKDALYFSTNIEKQNKELKRVPIVFEGRRSAIGSIR